MVDEDESVDLSFGLKGKVTVVTGGAAGIGAAIARAFVAKGARVPTASTSPSCAASDAHCGTSPVQPRPCPARLAWQACRLRRRLEICALVRPASICSSSASTWSR